MTGRGASRCCAPRLLTALGAERFLREIRLAARLNHPSILALFDSGDADGALFYVMPAVEGESLRDRLERDGRLPVDEAVRIATAVGGALDYAHRHGVVHRDVKPENILLQDGHALVADFGIGKAMSGAGERFTADRHVNRHASLHEPGAGVGRIGGRPRTSIRSAACSTRCWSESRLSPAPMRRR